jgi:nucleoside-diphosphate-sugar epimerase
MKAIPDIRLGIVDVRDVAELHILAMEKPQAKGERFLALSGGTMSLIEIVKLLKEKMPYVTTKAPTKSLPTFIIRLSSIFNDQAKAILPLVGINRNASNKKAKTILGWVPRTNEEAVTASVISLIKWKNLNI